jgi:hypothetical protein
MTVPTKSLTLADQETGAVLVHRPAGGAAPFVATREELPGVATPTLSRGEGGSEEYTKEAGPTSATTELPRFLARAQSAPHLGKPQE